MAMNRRHFIASVAATMTATSDPGSAAAGGKSDFHCIRADAWKMRVAQNDGEIYIKDHTAGRNNFLLPKPNLYHLERDPCESYDVAKKYPEILKQLQAELARELRAFPEETRAMYSGRKKQLASVVTPPGAAPRILTGPQPAWAWEPDDRR